MQQLEDIVDFYLTSDTNYALMITGEWGVGKTYYFKNILRHKIKETPTFTNNSKKYKPLLVSLFGLKSVEEIQTEIFLSLYPLLKNKRIKLGVSIGKALLKGIMHLKKLGEYYDYTSDIELDNGEWINFTEIVICFDDLERLSENLNFEEFIGYVNSLVENENVKILIIANENKIKQQNYFVLKEKVVGNSIEFVPEISKSFDSLIEIKFGGFLGYKEFLGKNKDFIINIFTINSSNLRILSFVFTYFHRIFSEVIKQISSFEILKDKHEEIFLSLLKFSITISIEYKEGRITFKEKEKLYISEFDWYLSSYKNVFNGNANKEKMEEEKSYREIFLEKYYPEREFTFFTSIFNFITGGSVFQFEELIIEIKKKYNIQENSIPPHYEVLNHLHYPNVFSLRDKEYRELTRKMLKYSDRGLYEITNYLTVFYYSSRFNNPLKLNIDKLEKRIIAGMKIGKSNYKYQRSLDFYFSADENSEYKDAHLRIRKVALEINNEIDTFSKTIDYKRLENNCYQNFQEFYQLVLNRDSQYFYEPIFKYFNVTKFYHFFLKSSGDTKWQIVRFWGNRYSDYPYSELKVEIDFLEALKNKIKIKLERLPKSGISNFIFNEHVRTLETSIDRLNRAK